MFGRLTVVAYTPKRSAEGKLRHFYRCKCNCGKITEVRYDALLYGRTKSCGCLQRDIASESIKSTLAVRARPRSQLWEQPFLFLGAKYGRLTILSLQSFGSRGPVFLCECDCGNRKNIVGYSLLHGNTKSCGCLQREKAAKFGNRLSPGEAAFNRLFYNLKRIALSSSREFSLTKEEVKNLTQRTCAYCGGEPAAQFKTPENNGVYVYNGLDRLDSKRGYSVDNVVSCCWPCNQAKNNRSVTEFIGQAVKIAGRFSSLLQEGLTEQALQSRLLTQRQPSRSLFEKALAL